MQVTFFPQPNYAGALKTNHILGFQLEQWFSSHNLVSPPSPPPPINLAAELTRWQKQDSDV